MRVGADTRYEQIAALMREALTRRPEAVRVADRIAGPFLAAVLLLALGAALVWSQIDPSRAVWVAVSVLIVTCPCALSLAAPSALLAATSALAQRGVLLRRVEALETLARVQHVMLDKTGTLTEAQPLFRSVRIIDDGGHGVDTSALVARAASLATWSTHPLSLALAAAHPATPAPPWHDVREVPGCGVEARDAQGGLWRLGSARWLGAGDGAALCFGRTGGPLLAFDFDEALADGAAQAVQALQRCGVGVTLLSGDTPERVQRMADRLGITNVIAAATPERKLAALREHQARRRGGGDGRRRRQRRTGAGAGRRVVCRGPRRADRARQRRRGAVVGTDRRGRAGRATGAAHGARDAAEPGLGRALQRGLCAAGAAGLPAAVGGGAGHGGELGVGGDERDALVAPQPTRSP